MLWISWKADKRNFIKLFPCLQANKYLCRFQRIHDENCGSGDDNNDNCDSGDDNEIVVLYTVEVCIRSTLNPAATTASVDLLHLKTNMQKYKNTKIPDYQIQ